MSKYMEAVSKSLRELMGEMSISEFSKKVGIPQPTISRYLAGKREITMENLGKIADSCNESVDYLMGRVKY